jgi:hypothetical protein
MQQTLQGGGCYGRITLKDKKIIDRWSMVIEKGQGNGEQIYKDTKNFITESKAPGISLFSC